MGAVLHAPVRVLIDGRAVVLQAILGGDKVLRNLALHVVKRRVRDSRANAVGVKERGGV